MFLNNEMNEFQISVCIFVLISWVHLFYIALSYVFLAKHCFKKYLVIVAKKVLS